MWCAAVTIAPLTDAGEGTTGQADPTARARPSKERDSSNSDDDDNSDDEGSGNESFGNVHYTPSPCLCDVLLRWSHR